MMTLVVLAFIAFSLLLLLGRALRNPGEALLLIVAVVFCYYYYGGGHP
jgi:hypothetical protein